MSQELQNVDWAIIGAYLVLVLAVGTVLRKRAGTSKESYFLADRSLPWWWAGASLAATTFAADTPLAVTGIIAERGFSGNWVWLSWLGVHAGVVVLFATMWNRSRVLTDAELVALRYSGRGAKVLRALRTGLYGLVFNCIILGWVLKAMVKIVTPFFHWDVWMPGVVADLSRVLPALGGAGGASDMITIAALVTLVGFYSGLGGIRGVILTDLFQLAIALVGSFWLAIAAWSAVGGAPGLSEGLTRLYGAEHRTLDFFPSGSGWFGTLEMGALAFGMYLVVQSYANMPGDGGGYLMQRLNTTPNAREARRASLFFLGLQYLVRTWPWFVVGAAGILVGPRTDQEVLRGFVDRVRPVGFWPGSSVAHGARQVAQLAGRWVLVVGGVIGILLGTHRALFFAQTSVALLWLLIGSVAICAGARGASSPRSGSVLQALGEEAAK